MQNNSITLKDFPKDESGLYIVLDLLTFDSIFRLFLRIGLSHDEILHIMLMNCSFNGIVFQERIHNNYYKKIKDDDSLIAVGSKTLIYHELIIKE